MRKFGKKLKDRSIKAAGGQPLRFEIDLVPVSCGASALMHSCGSASAHHMESDSCCLRGAPQPRTPGSVLLGARRQGAEH